MRRISAILLLGIGGVLAAVGLFLSPLKTAAQAYYVVGGSLEVPGELPGFDPVVIALVGGVVALAGGVLAYKLLRRS